MKQNVTSIKKSDNCQQKRFNVAKYKSRIINKKFVKLAVITALYQ